MPELPEVEKARSLCESHCVGKRVAECRTLEGGGGARQGQFDDKVLVPGASRAWDSLCGRTLISARRVGKRAILDFGPADSTEANLTISRSVVVGFGMTGAFWRVAAQLLRVQSS